MAPRPHKNLPPPIDAERQLPAELVLEIIARSDPVTLIRSAAACRLLSRDILDPSFIRRVTQQGGIVPPCILSSINTNYRKHNLFRLLSLIHPAIPAVELFFDDHMSLVKSPNLGDLLREYYLVACRGGLVLLRASHVHLPVLCVYDPITGHRTFLQSEAPGIPNSTISFRKCALLTAADNIGCSFLLFVGDLDMGISNSDAHTIKVQTVRSSTGAWEPVATHDGFFVEQWQEIGHYDTPIVLYGGIIHWLLCKDGKILTYDVRVAKPGMLELPFLGRDVSNFNAEQLQLRSYTSSDGHMLLRLLSTVGSTISIWHQLSGGGWALDTVIEKEAELRSLAPNVHPGRPLQMMFMSSGERSSAVLLQINLPKEMHMIKEWRGTWIMEIDLPSRLRAMKIFS
ncbi:hypothetical protein VPH35_133628 [Triticum aestivum]